MISASTAATASTWGTATIASAPPTTPGATATSKWTTARTSPAAMAPPAGDTWEATSVTCVHLVFFQMHFLCFSQQSQSALDFFFLSLYYFLIMVLHAVAVHARLHRTELRDRNQRVPVASMPERRHLHRLGGTLHLLVPSRHSGYANTHSPSNRPD